MSVWKLVHKLRNNYGHMNILGYQILDKAQIVSKLCQKCDVIKMREMREEVGKNPKKEMDNRHMDDFLHNFNTIWALSDFTLISIAKNRSHKRQKM